MQSLSSPMPMPKPAKSSRAFYGILAAYIVVSMAYYVANISGFIDKYFDLNHRAYTPFQLDLDTMRITSVRLEAERAGLAVGDVIERIDGAPYAGYAPWLTLIRNLHGGDHIDVGVRKPDGVTKSTSIALAGRDSSSHFSEWGGILFLYGLPPLICLLIGYWVVVAQSLHEGNAQQVLEHLFTEADQFSGKAPQYDDMTVLVLKLESERDGNTEPAEPIERDAEAVAQ